MTSAISAGMSPPRRKRSSSGSKIGDLAGDLARRRAAASGSPASQTRAHSCSSHRPMTFLSSRIVPSTPRSLVSAGSVKTGPGQLEAEQRPGAGGQDRASARRAAARRRRRRRCRGRRRCRRARRSRGARARAELRARLDQRAERPRGEAEALDQLQRPLARARVQQPGGRGVRALVGQLAAQPVGEQVGHERDRGRASPTRVVGQQLVDGVDRHVLDAGDRRSRRRARRPRCARRGSGRGGRARGRARPAARSPRPRCRRRRRRSCGRAARRPPR